MPALQAGTKAEAVNQSVPERHRDKQTGLGTTVHNYRSIETKTHRQT